MAFYWSDMEKRYQVFVSSTYADLKEERRKVIQTLLEMNCIPSGMEMFPAVNEEQLEFIKKIIDVCDYYILIIGGRYGSVTSEGISYTEKEYDYANSKGLNILAFPHENPDDIPVKNSEQDLKLRNKLDSFRKRVKNGHLVKLWNKADELPALISSSLSYAIINSPADGWVRANRIDNEDVRNENNNLRKRIQELENQITDLKSHYAHPIINNLAGLTSNVEIFGEYWYGRHKDQWKYILTFGDLFILIAPYLLENPTEKLVKSKLEKSMFDIFGKSVGIIFINDQVFQTIKVQLLALGLVYVQQSQTDLGGKDLFWSLSTKGQDELFQLRTIKNDQNTIEHSTQ